MAVIVRAVDAYDWQWAEDVHDPASGVLTLCASIWSGQVAALVDESFDRLGHDADISVRCTGEQNIASVGLADWRWLLPAHRITEVVVHHAELLRATSAATLAQAARTAGVNLYLVAEGANKLNLANAAVVTSAQARQTISERGRSQCLAPQCQPVKFNRAPGRGRGRLFAVATSDLTAIRRRAQAETLERFPELPAQLAVESDAPRLAQRQEKVLTTLLHQAIRAALVESTNASQGAARIEGVADAFTTKAVAVELDWPVLLAYVSAHSDEAAWSVRIGMLARLRTTLAGAVYVLSRAGFETAQMPTLRRGELDRDSYTLESGQRTYRFTGTNAFLLTAQHHAATSAAPDAMWLLSTSVNPVSAGALRRAIDAPRSTFADHPAWQNAPKLPRRIDVNIAGARVRIDGQLTLPVDV